MSPALDSIIRKRSRLHLSGQCSQDLNVMRKMLEKFNTANMYKQGQGDKKQEGNELSALKNVNFPM